MKLGLLILACTAVLTITKSKAESNPSFKSPPRSIRSVDSPGRYFRRFVPIGYHPVPQSSQSARSLSSSPNQPHPIKVRDLETVSLTACLDVRSYSGLLKCGNIDSANVQDAVVQSLQADTSPWVFGSDKMPVLLKISPNSGAKSDIQLNANSKDVAKIVEFAYLSDPLKTKVVASNDVVNEFSSEFLSKNRPFLVAWVRDNYNSAKRWLAVNSQKLVDWLDSNEEPLSDWKKNQENHKPLKLVWLDETASVLSPIDVYASVSESQYRSSPKATNLIIDDINNKRFKNAIFQDDYKIAKISENRIHNPAGSQPEAMIFLTDSESAKNQRSLADVANQIGVKKLPKPYFVDLDTHAIRLQSTTRTAQSTNVKLNLGIDNNKKTNYLELLLFDYSANAPPVPVATANNAAEHSNLVKDAMKQRLLSNGGKYEIKAVLLETDANGNLKPHAVLYKTFSSDAVPDKANIYKASDIPILEMSTAAAKKDITMLMMLDSSGPNGLSNLDFSSINKELNKEPGNDVSSNSKTPAQMLNGANGSPLPLPDFTAPFNDLNSPAIPTKNYTCNFDKSPERPTSAHRVRPSDIKVIATLGDSLSAGNGAGGKKLSDVALQYVGISFTGGGDGNLDTMTTIPNILKYYNRDLFGYSLGVITPKTPNNLIDNPNEPEANNGQTMLNVAVPGAKVRGIPEQAKDLVKRMKSYYSSQFDIVNDWKMVNIFIGHNDVCQSCLNGGDAKSSATAFADDLRTTLDYLQDNLNRTIVNLITNINVTILRQTHSNSYCYLLHTLECPCVTSKYNDQFPAVLKLVTDYQQLSRSLAVSGVYDDREDFTVVNQPALNRVTIPFKLVNGRSQPDLSFNAPDCFHLGKKGHAVAAKIVWNSMLSPIGKKPQPDVVENVVLECPDPNCPFIRTNRNSGDNCSDNYNTDLASSNIVEYAVVQESSPRKSVIMQFSDNFNYLGLAKQMDENSGFSWPTILGMLTLLAVAAFTISGVVIYAFKRFPRKSPPATERTPLLMAEDSV